ncbi:MAG: hypothetical protein HY929_04360 [Euryarchaeota archaeon]|nr:hypothetical protein [Euryarchaeota archaeon]
MTDKQTPKQLPDNFYAYMIYFPTMQLFYWNLLQYFLFVTTLTHMANKLLLPYRQPTTDKITNKTSKVDLRPDPSFA